MHEKELGDHGSYSAFALCTATYSEGRDQRPGLAFRRLSPTGQKRKGQQGASEGTNVESECPDQILV